MEAADDIATLIGELRENVLGPLFQDKELRGACTDYLTGWGCPRVVARLGVEAVAGIFFLLRGRDRV